MIPKILKPSLPTITSLVKAPASLLPGGGGDVGVGMAQPRRSFSYSQTSPRDVPPGKPGTPEAPRVRESSGSPGMPQVVKQVLNDVRKIDPSAPRDTRSQQFAELEAQHGPSLQACERTPTKSGREEFLAKTILSALRCMPQTLAAWTGGGTADLVRESGAHERVTLDRRAAFDILKEHNPREAAVYASVVHPGLREQYGIRMTGKEMAALGVEDKGPYLNQAQLLLLCDYTASDSGTFHTYRHVDVLKQQLGERGGQPFQSHIKDDLEQLRGALDTLAQHPTFRVKGDFYKGVLLDSSYLTNGLKRLCKDGLAYPQGTITSATSDPAESYVGSKRRNTELLFRGGESLRVGGFHDTRTLLGESGNVGQSEVVLMPGTSYYGAGMTVGERLDGATGVSTPYDRFEFRVGATGDNKGSA